MIISLVVVSFTVTAALSLAGLTYVLIELVRGWLAVRGRGREDPLLPSAAFMLVELVAAMWITDLLLLIVGVSASTPLPDLGILLAITPVIKLVAAVLVIRELRRQRRMYLEAKRRKPDA